MHMVCQEHESAYWDGAKGVCCDGNVYQPDIEDTSYACCPTGKEVSIVMGKENLNYCCSEGQKAYWNGSSAQCCATATHQIVTNYISGQTDTAYACCEVKEDLTDSSGWTIAGAVNGSCCSGWAKSETIDNGDDYNTIFSLSTSYSVRENGDVYYCGKEWTQTERTYVNGTLTYDFWVSEYYANNGKKCWENISALIGCWCIDKGEPKIQGEGGSAYCDP